MPTLPPRFTQYGTSLRTWDYTRKPEFRTSGHRTSTEGTSQYRLHCGSRPGEPRPAANRQQPEKQEPLMQPRKQEHEGFYELLVYKRLWLLVREGGFEPPYLGCWILSPRCLLTISYSCIIHAPKLMVQPLPYPTSARPGNSPVLFFNSLSLPKTKAPLSRGSVLDLSACSCRVSSPWVCGQSFPFWPVPSAHRGAWAPVRRHDVCGRMP